MGIPPDYPACPAAKWRPEARTWGRAERGQSLGRARGRAEPGPNRPQSHWDPGRSRARPGQSRVGAPGAGSGEGDRLGTEPGPGGAPRAPGLRRPSRAGFGPASCEWGALPVPVCGPGPGGGPPRTAGPGGSHRGQGESARRGERQMRAGCGRAVRSQPRPRGRGRTRGGGRWWHRLGHQGVREQSRHGSTGRTRSMQGVVLSG